MKRCGIILFIVLCSLLAPALKADAAPRVVVDGRTLHFAVAPVMERGSVLVPMRGVFEALGAAVEWAPGTQTITAVKGQTRVVLRIGSRKAYLDGRAMTLPAAPKLVRGATLVPLRFVGEALGADVNWDPAAGTVRISTWPGPVVRPAPVFDSPEVLTRTYVWPYGGRMHTCTLALPAQACRYYAGLERIPTNDLSVYVTEPYDDVFLAAVAAELQAMAARAGYGPQRTVEMVIAFVQNMEYVTDEASKGARQYPRYPLETLMEGRGDCEDTCILLASLLQPMGYGSVLILIEGDPGHMALGLKGRDLPGVYYPYGGARYYYVETTGPGWRVGDIPPEYRNRQVRLLPLVPQPVIVHQWRSTTMGTRLQLRVAVTNLGTGAAAATRVYAAFDAGGGKVYNPVVSAPRVLGPQSRETYLLELDVPRNVKTRLLVRVVQGGTILDESRSDWFGR